MISLPLHYWLIIFRLVDLFFQEKNGLGYYQNLKYVLKKISNVGIFPDFSLSCNMIGSYNDSFGATRTENKNLVHLRIKGKGVYTQWLCLKLRLLLLCDAHHSSSAF